MAADILLSFGSNLGDRKAMIEKAVELLIEKRAVFGTTLSSFYETEPVGYSDQPWFLNSALKGTTELSPEELFAVCKQTEKELGRISRTKWHEREIDIDVLFYGKLILKTDELEIPHPRLHERRFVLAPAAEIAPDLLHPVLGLDLSNLLMRCTDSSSVRILIQ